MFRPPLSCALRGTGDRQQPGNHVTNRCQWDFNYVLTMDEDNYQTVAALCRDSAVVRPFLDFATHRFAEEGGPEPLLRRDQSSLPSPTR